MAFIEANQRPLVSLGDLEDFGDLEPLHGLATQADVFMLGESHGIAENPQLVLRVLAYLHRLGYRYLALETDFTYTDALNEYLRTGDEEHLRKLDMWLVSWGLNTEEQLAFWRALQAWNRTLPEDERITVWGTDIAYAPLQGRAQVQAMLRAIPDQALAKELEDLFWRATQKRRPVSGLTQKPPDLETFEETFLAKTSTIKDTIPDYDKLAMTIRVLKETETSNRKETVIGQMATREETRMAVWRYLWDRYHPERTGKVLVYGGAVHAGFASAKPRNLAIVLNEDFAQTKGKVRSLAIWPVSGSFYYAGLHEVKDERAFTRGLIPERFKNLPLRTLILDTDHELRFVGRSFDAYVFLQQCTPQHPFPPGGPDWDR